MTLPERRLGIPIYINMAWKEVAEVIVPSDTDRVIIKGLNLDLDKAYMILATINVPEVVGIFHRLFFNEDEVATNYYSQMLTADGTSIWVSRYNEPRIITGDTGAFTAFLLIHIMRGGDGFPRAIVQSNVWTPATIRLAQYALLRAIDENVRSITFWSNVANGIGAGSKIIIYKVK